MSDENSVRQDEKFMWPYGIDPVFCEVHEVYPPSGICSSSDLVEYAKAEPKENANMEC